MNGKSDWTNNCRHRLVNVFVVKKSIIDNFSASVKFTKGMGYSVNNGNYWNDINCEKKQRMKCG